MERSVVQSRQRIAPASPASSSHELRERIQSEVPEVPEVPEVTPSAGGGRSQHPLLDELRARISAIVERAPGYLPVHPPASVPARSPSACFLSPPIETPPARSGSTAWTFGAEAVDALFAGTGLDALSLHEVKPATYADRAAALGFALAVAARRRRDGERRPILWAFTAHEVCEQGFPYGPGLECFGLDPAALLIVEARRDSEVLWALEEGLRSGALAAVLGSVGRIAGTPARRLQLAAQSGATPCLLLTDHGAPGVAVARTRWRIAAAESAPHPLYAPAPGAPRWRLALERCRQRPEGFDTILEWCDAWSPAPFRFRLAAALADREARPGAARRGTG